MYFDPLAHEFWGTGTNEIENRINIVKDRAKDWYDDDITIRNILNGDAKFDSLVSILNGDDDVIVVVAHGYMGRALETGDTISFPSGTTVIDEDAHDEETDPYRKKIYRMLLDNELSLAKRYRFDDMGNFIGDTLGETNRVNITPLFFKNRINNDKNKIVLWHSCWGAKNTGTYTEFADVFEDYDKLAFFSWTNITSSTAIYNATSRILTEIFWEMDTTGHAHKKVGEPDMQDVAHYVGGGSTTSVLTHFSKTNLASCHCPDEMEDKLGNKYPVIQIGFQCWMAENLAQQGSTGWCYDGVTANCTTYGALFTQSEANLAAPTGWELPSDTDWKKMEERLGMDVATQNAKKNRGTDEGIKLKAAWTGDGIPGIDLYGFQCIARRK